MNTLWIPGHPQGQPRHRTRVIRTKTGGQFTQEYYDYTDDQKAWMEAITRAIDIHMNQRGMMTLEGPIRLHLCYILPRPKYHFHAGKNWPKVKDLYADTRHISKPDLDNLVKMTFDVLTKAEFWKDDSQVWAMSLNRRFQGAVTDPCGLVMGYTDDELPEKVRRMEAETTWGAIRMSPPVSSISDGGETPLPFE